MTDPAKPPTTLAQLDELIEQADNNNPCILPISDKMEFIIKSAPATIAIPPIFYLCCRQPGMGMVRVFGRGFYWKDSRHHQLKFSERMGITGRMRIGPWVLGWL